MSLSLSLSLISLGGQIEVDTVAPDIPSPANQATVKNSKEDMTLPTVHPGPVTVDYKGQGLFGPETSLGQSKDQMGV